MSKALVPLLAGLLAATIQAAGAPPKASPAAHPDVVDTAATAYKIIVQRQYATPFELSLILTSEDPAPAKKFFERMRARSGKKKGRLTRQPIGRIEFPPLVRDKTPDQLADVIRAFRQNDFSAVQPLVAPVSRASLIFRADVKKMAVYVSPAKPRGKTFRNVFVVTSTLAWEHAAGSDGGLIFQSRRTVVFSARGAILDIQINSDSGPITLPEAGK